MSKISKSILSDIEESLNQLEKILQVFAPKNPDNDIEYYNHSPSKLKTCIDKTKYLNSYTISGGAFHMTYHANNTKDAMGKWASKVDNLCWAIFGYDIEYNETEENRMIFINNKLKYINKMLVNYLPN
tara:strand:- start:2201 stop:2584 length:384 start_codon:yes stop_codon:yes gene_type:complete